MRMETLSIPSDTCAMGFSDCGSPQYSAIEYAADYSTYSPAIHDYERSDSFSSYDDRKDSTSSYDTRKNSTSSSLFEDQYVRTSSYGSDSSDALLHDDLTCSLSNMSISSSDSGVCDTGLPYTANSIDSSCHISSPYNNNSGVYDNNMYYSNNSNSLRNPTKSTRQRKSACRGAQKGSEVPRRSSAPARQGEEEVSRKDSRVYDVQLESDNVLLFVPDLDLVKSHLMSAVRAEVDNLKEEIGELKQHITRVEHENSVLRQYAPADAIQLLGPPQPRRGNPAIE